jgi:hypothetical protein
MREDPPGPCPPKALPRPGRKGIRRAALASPLRDGAQRFSARRTPLSKQNSLYAHRESRTRPPVAEDDCPGLGSRFVWFWRAVLEGM